jgi:hypothetical protein
LRNSSPIDKTRATCGFSAWLHNEKEALLS